LRISPRLNKGLQDWIPGPTSISEVVVIEPDCGSLGKEIGHQSTVKIVFVAALQQPTRQLWHASNKAAEQVCLCITG
jgi:hypothetical protein